MKIKKQYRLIYSCLNCKEEFSLEEVYRLSDEVKNEVVCPICNGYIVNPKGESNTKGVAME